MSITKKVISGILLLTLMAPLSLPAHGTTPQALQKSCRNFVQGFYDWYLKQEKDNCDKRLTRSDLYKKVFKKVAFSPELQRRLKEDDEAQAKVPLMEIGLDFDPFLNGQNPGERYEVGQVTLKNGKYWVDVYVFGNGEKSQKPSVHPELVNQNGRWCFVNFHYDTPNLDLLSILKDLRERRRQQHYK
jgi:Protein of unknown function (DUF3828)